MKISKIGVTRCQILRLKCTKFAFRWGFLKGLLLMEGVLGYGKGMEQCRKSEKRRISRGKGRESEVQFPTSSILLGPEWWHAGNTV